MIGILFNQNGIIGRFLMSKPIRKLGAISFQIYGLHYAIICSLGCFLVNKGTYRNFIIYFGVVGTTIILASFIHWIDKMIQCNFVDKLFLI